MFSIQPTERIRYSAFPWWIDPAADRRVRPRDGRVDLAEADAVGPELVRVEVDLVLLRGAADGGDLGDARHAVELVADVPVLERPQLAEVLAPPLDGVPEDLADGRGVGGEVGDHALRQERRGDRELFEDALAGEVVVGLVLEDDRDHREVELARRPHDLDPGEPLEVDRERVGDLVLDLLGAAAHPVGEDDDLVLGQVGDRVDRHRHHGAEARDPEHERGQDHEEAVADRPLDDRLDHGPSSVRLSAGGRLRSGRRRIGSAGAAGLGGGALAGGPPGRRRG